MRSNVNNLMENVSNEIERTRNEFRRQILNKIAEVENFNDFHLSVRVMFMHLGLTLKQEAVEFLETRDWSDASLREDYMSEIEAFLRKHIK